MMNRPDTPTETMYRIYWRSEQSDGEGRSSGTLKHSFSTFSLEIAVLWLNSLNADEDNRRKGLRYGMEEQPARGSNLLGIARPKD